MLLTVCLLVAAGLCWLLDNTFWAWACFLGAIAMAAFIEGPVYNKAMARWKTLRMCTRCGAFFTPQEATTNTWAELLRMGDRPRTAWPQSVIHNVGALTVSAAAVAWLFDQFDEMLRRSEDTPLVLGLSLHTFIVGQPFRVVHLRRALEHMLAHRDRLWVTVPREISRYYRTLPAEAQLQLE